MTKRISAKYKKFKQQYIDLWVDGKRNVGSIKKIVLLHSFLYLISLKKQYLRNRRFASSKIFSRWNIVNANRRILPRVEKFLRKIPNKYLNLNSKSRVYKYIMRRNQYLFQSKGQLIGDFVFIMEHTRKKPIWRRTKFERMFRLKQLLQQYYGNISHLQFKNLCRSRNLTVSTKRISLDSSTLKKQRFFALALYQLLELRLDILLYRANFVQSMYSARQLIAHGAVFVNGVCVQSSNFIIKLFDCVELNIDSVNLDASLVLPKADALSLFFNIFGKLVLFSDRLVARILKKTQAFLLNYSRHITPICQLGKAGSNYAFSCLPEVYDLIGFVVLYTRYLHFVRALPCHLLCSGNGILAYKYPTKILYPFEFTVRQVQKVTNFISS